MNIYRIIPDDMYKSIAMKHNLNAILRDIFKYIGSAKELHRLHAEMNNVRQSFVDYQPDMIAAMTNSPVGTLPLWLLRDKTSSNNVPILRWRNVITKRNGNLAWCDILENDHYAPEVKKALLQIEKERLLLSLQLSLLNHIVRQLETYAIKMDELEKIMH